MWSTNESWAFRSALGWILSGPLQKNFANTISSTTQFSQANEKLTEQVEKWWKMKYYA